MPFLLIFLLRGWNATFRSGEAFIYLCGLTVGAVYENFLELDEEGVIDRVKRRGLRKADLGPDGVSYYVVAAIFFLVGLYFAVTQPHVRHSTTSYVQIILFFVGLVNLANMRFSFTRFGFSRASRRAI